MTFSSALTEVILILFIDSWLKFRYKEKATLWGYDSGILPNTCLINNLVGPVSTRKYARCNYEINYALVRIESIGNTIPMFLRYFKPINIPNACISFLLLYS
jgi:hypothetical protein